jgi:tetratricopeptide (TPR) repeat protein
LIRLSFVLLLLTGSLLFAETPAAQTNINAISEYLIQNPDDLTARVNLGYNYMLSDQPLLAIRAYRYVTERDSTNLYAWQGMLWAYNALANWEQAIVYSKTPLQQFPQDPALKNFTAYAEWNSYNALTAYRLYSQSNRLAALIGDTNAQSTALEGLGLIYSSFADYSLANKSFQQAQNLLYKTTPSMGMDSLKKLHLYTSLSYTNLENQKSVVAANQFLTYKRLSVNTGFEQFKIKGKRWRDTWSAGLDFQTRPVQIGFSGWWLDGKANLYPAQVYQTMITEKYWLNDLMLQPFYRFAWSRYPNFNVYQNDLAFHASYRRTTISARVVHSQRDVESLNGDETFWAYHTGLGYIFNKGYTVSLSAGKGRQDWSVSPVGYVVDSYETNTKYLGITFLMPLSKMVDLIYYQQLGYKQAIWHYTGSIAMKVSY